MRERERESVCVLVGVRVVHEIERDSERERKDCLLFDCLKNIFSLTSKVVRLTSSRQQIILQQNKTWLRFFLSQSFSELIKITLQGLLKQHRSITSKKLRSLLDEFSF